MTKMTKSNELTSGAGSEKSSSGNTGLPFGLCKKYGIKTDKDWTPRDAWEALDEKLGMKPKDFYEQLKVKENTDEDVELPSSQVATIKRIEDSIRSRKTEIGYIIGENGEIIKKSSYSHYDRTIFKDVPYDKIANAISTHNHPPEKGDNNMSLITHADMKFLKWVKGIRVVSPLGEISLIKTDRASKEGLSKVIQGMAQIENEYLKEKHRINIAIRNAKDFRDYDEPIEAWEKCRTKYYHDAINLLEGSAKDCGYVFRYKGSIFPKFS